MLKPNKENEATDSVAGSPLNVRVDNDITSNRYCCGSSSPLPTEKSSLLSKTMRQKLRKYKNAFTKRSLIVDILCIVFGLGSWVGVNSVFLQLPLLVENAPEGWSLPSYLVVIVQLANIGPIAYTLLHKFAPAKVKDAFIIFAVLVIGTVASILTAFLHQKTAFIGGKEYSVSLFALMFFMALIGCTSSVLFMPYMGRFKAIYLITYLIGEGLGGFLASIVSLIQGVGGNLECIPNNSTEGGFTKYAPPPRFSTRDFFFFTFSLMLCSTLAFILLNVLKVCKNEYAAVKIGHGNHYVYEHHGSDTKINEGETPSERKESPKILSKGNYRLLLIIMGLACFFGNGVFPSIQSYSCLPYGNFAYHLSVSLTSIANPVACFLAVFLPHTSIRFILTLCGSLTLITSYGLVTALMSPNPPLVGYAIGEALVVISWTVIVGLFSYLKLCITAVMRFQGGKSLVWVGSVSQAGSAVGSVLIFVLINYTNLFISYEPC